jgi:mannitol-1-phosphate/altronate dehydrogenase
MQRVPLRNGELDNHDDVCGDLLDPICRKASVFGLILASLAVRYKAGVRPYTIMSCDNLPHNGEVAKRRVLGAVADLPTELLHGDKAVEFAKWLEEEVKYPSTMVDRITPATSPQDVADLKEKAGIEDEWPVMCEPYKHWVIEDNFVDNARPRWEDVGALLGGAVQVESSRPITRKRLVTTLGSNIK